MSETQLANKPRNEIRTLIEGDKFKNEVARVLPKHLNAERFIRIGITATTRTPKLLECTPASFFKCLLDLSALGLEPDGRRAHLIPYGRECTLIIDWKGLAELAMRSGIVSVLHADVVCENDTFDYDRGALKAHKVNYRESRGKVFAVYALCRFKDGNEKCDVMSIEDVKAIQRRSRSGGNGPWVTDFNEMAKKTVFRRLSKWLPLSAEFRDALEVDSDPIEPDSRAEKPAIGRIVATHDPEPFAIPIGDDDDIPMGSEKEQPEHQSEGAADPVKHGDHSKAGYSATADPAAAPLDKASELRTGILAQAKKLDCGEKKLVKTLIAERLMEPADKFDALTEKQLSLIIDAWDETIAPKLTVAQ